MPRRPLILLLDSSAGECELFRIALPSGNTRGCMTKAKSLPHLRRAAIEMTKWMETDPELDLMDQILIENTFRCCRSRIRIGNLEMPRLKACAKEKSKMWRDTKTTDTSRTQNQTHNKKLKRCSSDGAACEFVG